MMKPSADEKAPSKTKMDTDGEDSGSDDDTDIPNVGSEWFD